MAHGNTIALLELEATMSGPRHGGARMERRHQLWVNGKLFEEYREGSQRPFDYATGSYYDAAIKSRVAKLEDVLDCKAIKGRAKP